MAKMNKDKLQATTNGNIETVVGSVDLHNGAPIALGDALFATDEHELEVMEAVVPSATKEVLIVGAPEFYYDETKDQLDFVTPTGETMIAYHMTTGDKVTIEQTHFAVTPTKGAIVTGGANYKYVVNDGTARTTFIVEALTTIGWDARPAARIRVL